MADHLLARAIAVAALTLPFGAACSSSGGGPLSTALCNDIGAGLNPIQVYRGQSQYDTPKEFADYAYGAMAISCPSELSTNDAWRVWLQGWGIDPDA